MTGTDSTPLRQHVGQSRLLHLLQEWARVEAESSRLDVAERLSGWLGAMETVTLEGALQSIEVYPAQTRKAGEPIDAAALSRRLHDATLEMSAGLTPAVPASMPLPPRGGQTEPAASAPNEVKVTYAPYYQRYLDLQKRMDQQVAGLRAELRQALTRGSPGLRQLVALDAVMDQMLGPRAQKLLASVPVFLERRFTYWRHAQERAPQPVEQWHVPGGWVHAFEHDMREMLLAELHLRLRPLQGLVEAAQNEQQKRT